MSFEINEYLISAFSLLLHAFALLNLMTCDFTSFILLLAALSMLTRNSKKFLIIKESTLWYEQYFNNMALIDKTYFTILCVYERIFKNHKLYSWNSVFYCINRCEYKIHKYCFT